MQPKTTPFYLIVIAIWLAWSAPTWWSRSMFMDGLWYATIARNLAVGIGEAWQPQLTETLGKSFASHPPLAFWLEGGLFALLGDHWWVERLYSGGMIMLSGLALLGAWRHLPHSGDRATGWLPLLFWVIMPLVPWTTGNNMLENTLLAALGGALYTWTRYRQQPRPSWLLLTGLGVWLAWLSKGPQALFFCTLPFWLGACDRAYGWRRGLRDALGLGALVAGGTVLLALWPPARHFGAMYRDTFEQGNLAVAVVESHVYLLGRWVAEALPALLLTGLLAGLLRRYLRPREGQGWPLALLLTSLSGVLPHLLVLKQRAYYLLPTLPFLALGLALLVAPAGLRWWQTRPRFSNSGRGMWAVAFLTLAVAGAVGVASWGRPGRNADQLALSQAVAQVLSPHQSLGCCPAVWHTWSLHGYLYRQAYVSLRPPQQPANTVWRLVEEGCPSALDTVHQRIGAYRLGQVAAQPGE